MRAIEFRAWHIEASEMIYPDQQGDVFRWKDDGQPIDIMQYTGLTDKNGVKVFEGDIVEEPKVPYENGNYSRGLIVFIDGEFSIQYKHSDRNLYDRIVMAKREIVVGNIHQNPELLEKK